MSNAQSYYYDKHDLNKLAHQLTAGMEVPGRIVQCVGDNIYLLRVRGFNIITESFYPFLRFDEVRLIVKSVDPQFVFQVKPINLGSGGVYA